MTKRVTAIERQKADEQELSAAEERQKRIEHLKQGAMRRMLNAGLARGWSAWEDLYREKKREQQLLRQAAARLARPALAAAMALWASDWDAAEQEKQLKEQEARLASEKNAVYVELQMVRLQLDQMAEALEAEKEKARHEKAELEKDFREGGAAAEAKWARRMEEQLAAEREKRIEHLKQSALRRMANAGIAVGWTAWTELYFEQKREQQLLAGAAARLARPALAACVAHWVRDWQEARLAGDKMASYSELSRVREQLSQMTMALEAARADAARAVKAAAEQAATERESHMSAEAEWAKQVEEERQRGVAHVQQSAMRRMANASLARGWSAWEELFLSKKREKQLLRQAAARLARPALAACMAHWTRDWEVAERRKLLKAQEALFKEDKSAAYEELKRVRKQLRQATAALDESRNQAAKEREAMEAEFRERGLSAEAEWAKATEERLAAERERRVAHKQQSAMRRMANASLARGWSAWEELFLSKKREKQLLRQAAARLVRPALAACMAHWTRDWEVA